ncbi:MAG: hypothetical protein LBQ24_04540 [Candidatus Peribacteria bacterium]|jgi:hypothetical protein|nr:hypothetical protein [Candidatus Peribacteria bacterium]
MKLKNYILIPVILLLTSCFGDKTTTITEEEANINEIIKENTQTEEISNTDKSTNNKLDEIRKKLNLK